MLHRKVSHQLVKVGTTDEGFPSETLVVRTTSHDTVPIGIGEVVPNPTRPPNE